jgi:peptide/nickel transport system permease protein
MMHFLIRRLQAMVPVVIIVSMFTFGLLLLLPGDPALMMLGEQYSGDRAAYAALRDRLGLNKPLPLQYLDWAARAVQGNLGRSLRDKTPVTSKISTHVFPTIELASLAMTVALLIAVPTAVTSALRPNSLKDYVATVAGLSGVVVPSFFLGILMIYVFSVWLRVLPPSGYVPPWENLGQNLKLLVMPALALSAGLAAVLMRQIRSALIEVMQEGYIVTARAKGLSESIIVARHALKNALIPVATIVGLQVGGLIGGTVVIETIFAIPGMGRMMVDSIFFRDFPTVQGVVILLAVSTLLANFLTDVAYAYLDPRIRYG